MTEVTKPARTPEDKQLAEELVERARDEGVDLVGPGGLLTGLTKSVLEAGLEAEMTEHLGYDKHDPQGREADLRAREHRLDLVSRLARGKAASPKVGRNERCPCGSGRKYEHCHGR